MFYKNLKRLREAKGLTQFAFSGALGTPLRTVQGWEQGRREPSLDMLRSIARVLGVSADSLVEAMEAGDKPAPKRRPRKVADKPAPRPTSKRKKTR